MHPRLESDAEQDVQYQDDDATVSMETSRSSSDTFTTLTMYTVNVLVMMISSFCGQGRSRCIILVQLALGVAEGRGAHESLLPQLVRLERSHDAAHDLADRSVLYFLLPLSNW